MSGPVIEMAEEITDQMRLQSNKQSASTLATSASMLSLATAIPSSETISSDKDQAVGWSQPRSSNLRVRTLSESLKSPDIFHSLERRSVGFDSVEIREYGIILGWYVIPCDTAYYIHCAN